MEVFCVLWETNDHTFMPVMLPPLPPQHLETILTHFILVDLISVFVTAGLASPLASIGLNGRTSWMFVDIQGTILRGV